MPPRIQLFGAQNRKRKRQQQNLTQSLQGSLNRYFVRHGSNASENIVEENNVEENNVEENNVEEHNVEENNVGENDIEVGLRIFQLQERIPYQIIDGHKPARDDIEDALTIVCLSNKIALAQVWISFQNDNHVSLLSYLEDTRMKQMLSLKLTGYLVNTGSEDFPRSYGEYYRLCDMFSLEMGEDFVEKTLEDYKPRICNDVSKLSGDTLIRILLGYRVRSRLAICLRSIHTGAFLYVFEFIWDHDSDLVIFVEALLLTLQRFLPSFKHASGAELGDELDVIDVENSTTNEIKFVRIFKGDRLSPISDASSEGNKDWILLTSEEDISDCIKTSKNSDHTVVRLRVEPST